MTATGRHSAFAGLDPPERWPLLPRSPRPERLELGLDTLPGVGPTLQRKLAKLGLATVRDILEHRPRRYETAADEVTIAALREGEDASSPGVSSGPRRSRCAAGGAVVARVDDGTAAVSVSWFNQPWLADKLTPGTQIRLRGKLGRFAFEPRCYDLGEARATADFAPVYPAAEEIAAASVRRVVDLALPLATNVPDPLPAELREREGLPLKRDALAAVHRPDDLDEAERGRARLAFEELLVLRSASRAASKSANGTLAAGLGEPGDLIRRYREALPFALTPYQEEAIREIDGDLARTTPMQRLLQGDVGSGKTVVALTRCSARSKTAGRARSWRRPDARGAALPHDRRPLPRARCQLRPASRARRRRRSGWRALAADVVVGTRACHPGAAWSCATSRSRSSTSSTASASSSAPRSPAERAPHVLHMTATPIPRTLALTVYGDLAVSEIKKPPASRKPIITSWITEERASEAYTRLTRLLDEGRQAYIVPLIEL